MGRPSYIRSVVDRNVVMRRLTVLLVFYWEMSRYCTISCTCIANDEILYYFLYLYRKRRDIVLFLVLVSQTARYCTISCTCIANGETLYYSLYLNRKRRDIVLLLVLVSLTARYRVFLYSSRNQRDILFCPRLCLVTGETSRSSVLSSAPVRALSRTLPPPNRTATQMSVALREEPTSLNLTATKIAKCLQGLLKIPNRKFHLEVRHPRCVGSITKHSVYYTYSPTQL